MLMLSRVSPGSGPDDPDQVGVADGQPGAGLPAAQLDVGGVGGRVVPEDLDRPPASAARIGGREPVGRRPAAEPPAEAVTG